MIPVACANCRYFIKQFEYVQGVCVSVPKDRTKNPREWCGQFHPSKKALAADGDNAYAEWEWPQ